MARGSQLKRHSLGSGTNMRWWIDTKDKPGLLWAFLDHFVDGATAAFEGDLADLGLKELPGAANAETDALHRQTRSPMQDFVTVPITPQTIRALKERLAAPGLFRDGGPLLHIQIEHAQQLVFLAGDNFHRECVSAFPPVPEQLLERLRIVGIIRSYTADAAA